MHHQSRPVSSIAAVALSCLLLGGCASEKALLTQTQPLQDRLDRVEKDLATAGDAGLRAAEARTNSLAARQAELERQLAQLQTNQAARLDATETGMAARIGRIEKNLNELAEQTRKTAQQSTQLQARQDAARVNETTANARVGELEQRLNDMNRVAQAAVQRASNKTDALNAKQEAAEFAGNALNKRVSLAEAKLNTLSGLVQEALALAAKEIFLANGKEALTVTLTEDKVLYPQNDPNLDSRDAAKLNDLADKLGQLDQEYHLDIQGHTANNSTEDNNYSLGKARAEVVKRYLHEKKGISISRMSALSYGANKPLDPNGSNNRRIYIRVLVLK